MTTRAAAATLDELRGDPFVARRGPSVDDYAAVEDGIRSAADRLEQLVQLRVAPAFDFVVNVWREHPSWTLCGRLEAAMLTSREPGLLAPIAALVNPEERVNHPASLASICEATIALDAGRAFDVLSSHLQSDCRAAPRDYELTRTLLVLLERDEGSLVKSDPRWLDPLHRMLAVTEDEVIADAIVSILTLAGNHDSGPTLLALLDTKLVSLENLAFALSVVGDRSMVSKIRSKASHVRRSDPRGARALEECAGELEGGPAACRPARRTIAPLARGRVVRPRAVPNAPFPFFPIDALFVDGNVLEPEPSFSTEAHFFGWPSDGGCLVRLRSGGHLELPTGKIVACDPLLAGSRDKPLRRAVTPGRYRVELCVLSFRDEGDDRVGAATIRFRDEMPVRWEKAVPATYAVDTGRGAFLDASVLPRLVALAETAQGAERIHANRYGSLVLDRRTKANLVSFSSGNGDGEYPSAYGLDERGAVVCLTTIFLVVPVYLDLA